MAQEPGRGYYVDVYEQLTALFPDSGYGSGDILKTDKVFDTRNYFGSSMEHAIIEQLQTSGLTAASTVSVLEKGEILRIKQFILPSSANWTNGAENVKAHLINYDVSDSTGLGGYINRGYNLLLPTNGSVQIAGTGSWKGFGVSLNNK